MNYQFREIGESGWMDCSYDWYMYCQQSPEFDTRKGEYLMQKPTRIPNIRTPEGEALELFGTVALVGNSDILTNSRHGSKIDSFDNVIRFNRYETDGFETDVGAKTSHLFLCLLHTMMATNVITHRVHYPDIPVICFGYNPEAVKVGAIPEKPYLLDDGRGCGTEHFLSSLPEDMPQLNGLYPRSGLRILTALLEAGIKPTVFGFDSFENYGGGHYFDDERQGQTHDIETEAQIISNLAKFGYIELGG